MKWEDIQKEVKTMEGKRPKSDKPVRNAVTRVSTAGAKSIAMTMYHNWWTQIWGRWWEVPDHTQAGKGGGELCQDVEEQKVLHMQVHQEGVEMGGHT